MDKWISVKERLPDDGQAVLAFGNIGEVRTSPGVVRYYEEEGWWSLDRRMEAAATVTHWLPLPAPPKEG